MIMILAEVDFKKYKTPSRFSNLIMESILIGRINVSSFIFVQFMNRYFFLGFLRKFHAMEIMA